MNDAISISHLDKSFGTVQALDSLDLAVAAGEVAGFLGPNGAGKSTTIRVLLGLMRADAGSVRLLDGDPWAEATRLHKRLAYVPGDVNLWPSLSGGEAIDLFSRLRGSVDPRRRAELLERFELDPTKKGRTYSKGNRQKVALVAALAADVELYILDEPTSGLDPLMERVFQECIRELRAEGRSILLSSHILAEVETLCDTVTIIRGGRTVQSGTLDDLRHLTRATVTAALDGDTAGLADVVGVHDLRADDGHVTFSVDNSQLTPVLEALAKLGPRNLVCSPPSLEELFMRQYSAGGAGERHCADDAPARSDSGHRPKHSAKAS
ncbi:ABC transporter ATP-binding protein [Spelaeicoccus albus]|uniref:ABC-2 type transport system ATP-binding protein n=1 Tax=Spelaeicoccus albus TaxID=1280376 RepID=A0A7Z0CZM9_9MICO|nr:ABC transporter ATP-binding protein [Spelaeicoccus albus]NYI66414.1 ABC-2 type transport system ATP-binding protein [Spelaeicoccus albus]